MSPDSGKPNTKAILHGIGRVLHGFNQDISEEPLPKALTELVKRLEQRLLDTDKDGKQRSSLTRVPWHWPLPRRALENSGGALAGPFF
jgi:hypothetical protein